MIKKIKCLLNKNQRIYIGFLFFGICISSLLEMVGIGSIPIFINLFLKPDQLITYLPHSNLTNFFIGQDYFYQILFAAFILLAIFLFKNFFLFLIIYFQAKVFRNLKIETSKRLFQAYVNSPYYLHLNRNPASMGRNVTNEAAIATKYIDTILYVMREVMVILAVITLLLLVDPITVMVVFIVISFFIIIYHLLVRKKITKLSLISQFHLGNQLKLVNHVFGSIKDTKILDRGLYFINKFKDSTEKTQRFEFFYSIVNKLPRLFLEVLGIIIILFVTILFIANDRSIDTIIPTLGLLGAAIVRMLPSFNGITAAMTAIRGSQVSFDLVVRELMKLEKYTYEKSNLSKNKMLKVLDKNVELKNITYKYPDSDKEVLKNLSLDIKSGSSIGIIGRTGSGKSTLAAIILGLLKPTNGQIMVDGININIDNNYLAWQKHIGYIPQDIFIIDDTIKSNIAFGLEDHDINDEDIKRAAKLAQLTDFILDQPLKFDTIVGDRGIRLSGGQRQRIGIARALYRKSKLLLFDEATSSLDIETEKAIVDCIKDLEGKATLIVITHRLQTLKNFNNIYFIKGGSISNRGSYEEMIKNDNIYTV